MLLLMGPGTIGLAATQLNVFVITVLATGEGTGAVSWLDFAFRLIYLPIGLFGVSIATAASPLISRMVADRTSPRIRATLANGLGLMLFLNLPATAGLLVLARPIVAVLLEHGGFTAADTGATAAALRLYAIGLVGYSAVRIVSPTFYALQRSAYRSWCPRASMLVNVALNLALVRVMGYRGLALGTSITAIVNASVQLLLLRREISGLEGARMAASLMRVLIAAAVMGIVTATVQAALERLIQRRRLCRCRPLRLVITIAAVDGRAGGRRAAASHPASMPRRATW